jgi:hypothetical protein
VEDDVDGMDRVGHDQEFSRRKAAGRSEAMVA